MGFTLSKTHYEIISLISGFLITAVFGSVYCLGTITPYIASFMYYEGNSDISVSKVSILYPVYTVCQSLGIIFSSVYLQKILAYRTVELIGICLIALCVFISSFFTSFPAFVIFYGAFYGFFVGCCYIIPMLNCYSYLPNKKGLCSGICMMAFGIGAILFNYIFLHLINPENKKANEQKIFPKQVAENVPIALKYISLVYLVIGLIGSLLLIEKSKLKPNIENNPQNSDKQSIKQSLISENQQSKQDLTQSVSSQFVKTPIVSKPNSYITLLSTSNQFFKSEEYKQLILMIVTSFPFCLFLAFNYKEYGLTLSKDDNLLTLVGSLGAVSNAFSRIFWGWAFDKWKFKTITLIMNTTQIIYAICLIFIKNQYLYLVLVLLIYFSYGGVFSIYPAQTTKLYGQANGGRIYSIVYIGVGLASIIQFIFHFFIVQPKSGTGYLTCFLVFGSLMIIAEILFIKTNFNYEKIVDVIEKSNEQNAIKNNQNKQ